MNDPQGQEDKKEKPEEVEGKDSPQEATQGQEKQPENSTEPVQEKSQAAAEETKASEEKKQTENKKADGEQKIQEEAPEFIEKVIAINRITKVTKGGKKMSFSALVVVGDAMGNVGYSLSKAREVASAIRKAMATAKKNMIKIPRRGTTIPHEIIGQCGGARVLLKPASDGTGVIASGPVRAVCAGAGIHNILTKCHRSNNPINVVKATFNGLTRLKSVE